MSTDLEREQSARELVHHCIVRPISRDVFEGTGPDWFGDRVFGGIVVAQALNAAMQTVEERVPHSMHGYFLRPERPGPLELRVERVRDGRTFSTRRVTLVQQDKELCHLSASFHGEDHGPDYQMPMPADVPPPGDPDPIDGDGPPFDTIDLGPSARSPDGTYASTRRAWIRSLSIPDEVDVHYAMAAYMSDWTGTSFRPLSMDVWGHDADASVDHAVWFHRPVRVDDWMLVDFQALINHGGRSTVRGCMYTKQGDLFMSMAQELLIRPLRP